MGKETGRKPINKLEEITTGIAWGLGAVAAVSGATGIIINDLRLIYLEAGFMAGCIVSVGVAATSYIARGGLYRH